MRRASLGTKAARRSTNCDRAPFLPAHPVDEIEHQPAGEVARVLHCRALDDAAALVAPSGKGLPIE
jgi:hypothetical protein